MDTRTVRGDLGSLCEYLGGHFKLITLRLKELIQSSLILLKIKAPASQ